MLYMTLEKYILLWIWQFITTHILFMLYFTFGLRILCCPITFQQQYHRGANWRGYKIVWCADLWFFVPIVKRTAASEDSHKTPQTRIFVTLQKLVGHSSSSRHKWLRHLWQWPQCFSWRQLRLINLAAGYTRSHRRLQRGNQRAERNHRSARVDLLLICHK